MSDKLQRKRWIVNYESAISTFAVLENLLETCPTLRLGKLMNLDETCFTLDGRAQRVVTRRGAKNTHLLCPDGRWSMTIIPFVFANGMSIPPVAIVSRISDTGDPLKDLPAWWFDKDFQNKLRSSSLRGMRLAVHPKSYNTANLFQLIWEKHLLPCTRRLRNGPTDRMACLIDNFSGHCDPWMLEWLSEEHYIDVVDLPPHSSHFSQPLDRRIMQSVKVCYSRVVRAYMKKTRCKEIREKDVLVILSQP